jgi:lipopolysaccharide export system protein LptC
VTTRRLLTSLFALALAIGVVQGLLWWLEPASKPQQMVGPPRSSYTLHEFTLDGYGPKGHMAYQLSAPQLERREGDASMYINQPRFVLPPKNGSPGKPWTGHAAYGWISANGNLIKLQGEVHMQRPAFDGQASAQIDTSDVTAWPHQNRLETDQHVAIVQGTTRMTGTGMRADFNNQHMELLHDFHGTFLPSGTQP